jgi:hypothetical protein
MARLACLPPKWGAPPFPRSPSEIRELAIRRFPTRAIPRNLDAGASVYSAGRRDEWQKQLPPSVRARAARLQTFDRPEQVPKAHGLRRVLAGRRVDDTVAG